jgi:zinc protease
LDTFNDQVSKVTAAQIKDAFNRRLKTDKMVTVIVAADEANP